jgi:hypothetical protein
MTTRIKVPLRIEKDLVVEIEDTTEGIVETETDPRTLETMVDIKAQIRIEVIVEIGTIIETAERTLEIEVEVTAETGTIMIAVEGTRETETIRETEIILETETQDIEVTVEIGETGITVKIEEGDHRTKEIEGT